LTNMFVFNGAILTNQSYASNILSGGQLAMGTVVTGLSAVAGPFITSNTVSRSYSYNANALTNINLASNGLLSAVDITNLVSSTTFGQVWYVWGSSNTLATNAGGIAYKAMQKSDVTLPALANTNTYVNPTVGTYFGEVITAIPAGVTTITPGDIVTVSYGYLSANQTITAVSEIYIRTNMQAAPGAGEREIGVGNVVTINNTFQLFSSSAAITTNVSVLTTSYLVRKYKVVTLSAGTPNVLLVSQGSYPARITFPIGSSSFVLKSGDTMSGNLALDFASAFYGSAIGVTNLSTNTQTIWIDAGAMLTNGVAGAPSTALYSPTNYNNPSMDVWDFDSATPETNFFKLMMSDSWDLGTLKVKFYYFNTDVTASTSNVWAITAASFSPASLIDLNAYGTEVSVTNIVGAATNALNSCISPALTVGSTPALGDIIIFRLRRVADSGWDNAGGDARLTGVAIQWNDKRNNPATW